MYKCSVCEHTTDLNNNIKRHIKTTCKEATVIKNNLCVECKYCNKTYKSNLYLIRHLKICKLYDHIKENEKLKLENEKVKKENEILKNSGVMINSNNTINNITINITPYTHPNLEGMEKYYLTALKKIFLSVPTLVEYIHFNNEHPENHNIYISNYRNKMVKVYDGENWDLVSDEEAIKNLLNTYELLFENWAEGNPERTKYIDKYRYIKERDGEAVVAKGLFEELKRLIYNKRGMVKSTVNKTQAIL